MANRPCTPIAKALALSLGTLGQPVITRYQAGCLLYKLYRSGQFQSQPLCVEKNHPKIQDFNRVLAQLLDSGVLEENRNFPARSVFNLLGQSAAAPEEIVCTVDPFAYVSHLSAMAFHGLTDRIPKILNVSSAPPNEWRVFAQERLKRDLGEELPEYLQSGFPKLTRIRLNKVSGRPVHVHARAHFGAFKTISGRMLRVSTIGRTFLDMLREPDLCGGIRHVLDGYKEHAHQYLKLITDEIDSHGSALDKVRAGYVLDEVCHLTSETIAFWTKYAQRGGSRKLIASASYSPKFSERWCLSINIEEA